MHYKKRTHEKTRVLNRPHHDRVSRAFQRVFNNIRHVVVEYASFKDNLCKIRRVRLFNERLFSLVVGVKVVDFAGQKELGCGAGWTRAVFSASLKRVEFRLPRSSTSCL